MKVLLVNSVCGRGSTGKIVVGIADALVQNSDTPYIAYGFYHSNISNSKKLKVGSRLQSFYEIMRCRITGYMGFTSKIATYKLIHWIKEVKPDIVNLHIIHNGYLHLEILFEFLAYEKIPVVWTFHDCWAFTGHCSHFQMVNCEKWKTKCFDCPEKESYPKRYFFDRSTEQFMRKKHAFSSIEKMTIVTPSKWMEELVKQSFMGYASIYTIHNGINLDVFKPQISDFKKLHNIENKKVVLAVSLSWGKRKGFHYLLELANYLPNSKYQIVIVGLNSAQLKSLPRSIIGITRTHSQDELAQIYSAADVFVNPTLEDTYPTVNLESLACGTPVVTFRTGGSPESITDEIGAVVEQGNLDELANKVMYWANANVSKECREYALSNFSASDCFENYVSLFKKIIYMENQIKC